MVGETLALVPLRSMQGAMPSSHLIIKIPRLARNDRLTAFAKKKEERKKKNGGGETKFRNIQFYILISTFYINLAFRI